MIKLTDTVLLPINTDSSRRFLSTVSSFKYKTNSHLHVSNAFKPTTQTMCKVSYRAIQVPTYAGRLR